MNTIITHSRGEYVIKYGKFCLEFPLDQRIAVICDSFFYSHLNSILGNTRVHLIIPIESSERNKTLSTVDSIISELFDHSPINHIIAIGGGVVQDLAGFTCSIFKRGLKWTFIPTTLLAQGDSCLGSKTSINYHSCKNLLGTFHPPNSIYIDTDFLSSLSDIDIISGVGDMLHYALVMSTIPKSLCNAKWLEFKSLSNIEKIQTIQHIHSIKKTFIELDEFDTNFRRLLNFGHSFGHAIECASNYQIPHGLAVIYGMVVACFLSTKLSLIQEYPDHYTNLLVPAFKVCYQHVKDISLDKKLFLDAIYHDKKNKSSENINIILPSKNVNFPGVCVTDYVYSRSKFVDHIDTILNATILLDWCETHI